MTPLRLQVLFHWDSLGANDPAGRRAWDLAQLLYRTFAARPGGEGPRIPVRYGARQPDGGPPATIELSAEHEVLVVLVDGRMARRARAADRLIADRWGKLVGDLVREHGPGTASPHRVLPVALDAAALGLSSSLDSISFVRLDVRERAEQERHLVLHAAVRALRALQDMPPAPGPKLDEVPHIPVTLFVSHAKADLPRDAAAMAEGPVRALVAALAQLPVDGWYDAKKIPPGGRFDQEIRHGVVDSSALVAVLTDSWSSREWCRREVMEAKAAGRPLVVVDALQARTVRLFPYVGNAPTLRWRAASDGPEPADMAAAMRHRQRQEAEDAAIVIEAALLEALRYRNEHARLGAHLGEHDVAFGTAPEALTLSMLPAGTRRVWYPDPPLGREELERLLPPPADGKAPGLVLTTPLGELARWERPAVPPVVAVSLSGAPDSFDYGGSPQHLATFADDIVLYLLIAGLRVAYGGVLGHDGTATDGDEVNHVERLLGMARSHSALIAESTGGSDGSIAPIENWVAWPIHRRFGDDELRVYGRDATLAELDPPPDLEVATADLHPLDNGFFPPDTPARRYAWSRSLTFMRQSMQAATAARILMGGKLTRFQGLWPGVLEEGVLALRARQPLYPLGVFGGAARLLIDTLQGIGRDELSSGWWAAHVPERGELAAEYRRHDRTVELPEDLAAELKAAGAGGLAAALQNGLSDAENRELIGSDDPHRVVTLILQGLRRKLGA